MNPSKLDGIRRAFNELYGPVELEGVSVATPRPQPFGLEEILEGARSRAIQASAKVEEHDFAVGLEAGIILAGRRAVDIQVAFILASDGKESVGFSPGFPLPSSFVEPIMTGVYRELEEAADAYYGTKSIGEKGGVIKLLSKGLVTREELSYQATLMALIAFANEELYFP